MKTRNKLIALIMSALAVLGLGGAALAQSGSQAPDRSVTTATDSVEAAETNEAPDQTEQADEVDGPADEAPAYQASITVPTDQGTADGETADDEAAESADLAGLAKIDETQARDAALAAVPGRVVKVELDNENGNVVYSVEVDTGKGVVDVKVDAGNGTVLHQESGNED